MLIPRNTRWHNLLYHHNITLPPSYFATLKIKEVHDSDEDFSELWIWHLTGENDEISDGADINGKKPLSQWWRPHFLLRREERWGENLNVKIPYTGYKIGSFVYGEYLNIANAFQSFPHLIRINFDKPRYNLSSNKSNKFEQMMCDKSFEFLSRRKKFSWLKL